MPIKKLPSSERPYEKIMMYGAEKLSDSELLAIIIKTGTKEKTAIELAQDILSMKAKGKETIRFIQDKSIEEFMQIKGIGKVKAIQLKAVCELTKRISKPAEEKLKIKTPRDVANLLMDELKFEKREKIKELILNTKNVLTRIIDISYGGTNFAIIDPKDVLCEPVKIGEPKIILVHNHPSGDPTPSKQDIETTKAIIKAAKLFGIEMLDHIIIGDNKYESVLPYLDNI